MGTDTAALRLYTLAGQEWQALNGYVRGFPFPIEEEEEEEELVARSIEIERGADRPAPEWKALNGRPAVSAWGMQDQEQSRECVCMHACAGRLHAR